MNTRSSASVIAINNTFCVKYVPQLQKNFISLVNRNTYFKRVRLVAAPQPRWRALLQKQKNDIVTFTAFSSNSVK